MADSLHRSETATDPSEKDPTDELIEQGREHLLEEESPHPRGTMVILLLYLVATIGFWGFIYSMLFYGG